MVKILFILLAISLLVLPVVAATYTMERHDNQNIQGGDYYHYDIPPAVQTAGIEESCRDQCLADARCTAVTYQRPAFTGTPNANCWLKTGTTASQLVPQHDTVIWLKVMEKVIPQAPPATCVLTIRSDPAGAQIFLNGADTGQVTAHTFDKIAPGTYTARLHLEGYEDRSGSTTLTAGQGGLLDMTLHKVQPAAPATGALSISSSPSGAAVIVDGTSKGVTPTTVSGLTAGSHTIRVTMPGYGDYEGTATVTAGQTTPVTVSLSAVIITAQITGSQTTTQTTGSGTGFIEVRSQPSGAAIILDGAQKGSTPAKLTNVKSGSHEVMLKLAGYPDWKQTVTVKTGETASINAVLGTAAAGTAAPSAAGTGSLSVTTVPAGAQVYLDGSLIGNSPTKNSGLAPGSHTLLIKLDGYQDLPVTVTITAGQTTEYSSSLVASTSGIVKKTPGFTAVFGILAVMGIIAGRRYLKS